MWKSDLPYEITAGTTIKWVDESTTRGLNQVISSPDWTLKYYLRTNKLGGAYTATGTQYQSSTGWEFTISASDTGSLEPGDWFWSAIATKGSEVFLLGEGRLLIRESLIYTGTPNGIDKRTQNEKDLDECTNNKIVVIKSTIPPGTTSRLNYKYKNNTIIFSPEFLTEANSIEDFKNQTRIILGGDRKGTNKLRVMFSKVFPQAHIIKTDSTYAEMIKYLTNNFLTVKVAFANEMYKVCEGLQIDYDKVVEYSTLDERLGKSHWNVPGPDGDYGYGGHCFPKDIAAMISLTEDLQTPNHVLRGAKDTNDEVRTGRDWEEMEGRAVIKKDTELYPWHRVVEEVRP